MGAKLGDFPMGGKVGTCISSTDSNCAEKSCRSLIDIEP